jgi:hypothetical protein
MSNPETSLLFMRLSKYTNTISLNSDDEYVSLKSTPLSIYPPASRLDSDSIESLNRSMYAYDPHHQSQRKNSNLTIFYAYRKICPYAPPTVTTYQPLGPTTTGRLSTSSSVVSPSPSTTPSPFSPNPKASHRSFSFCSIHFPASLLYLTLDNPAKATLPYFLRSFGIRPAGMVRGDIDERIGLVPIRKLGIGLRFDRTKSARYKGDYAPDFMTAVYFR